MKLPELKKHLKSKYVVQIVAGVLTIALLGSGMTYTARAAKGDGSQPKYTSEQSSEEKAEDTDSLASLLSDVDVKQKEIGKAETVYFLSDAKGNVTKTIVSDHLINKDKKDTLEDVSSLKDIKNVKGQESFSQNGDKITWQAGGEDIYYQGTTDAKEPVSQKVTYFLDGKEIEPEDLAGKSGHVEIHYDFQNNTSFTEKVNGKDVTVVVPFATLTAVSLNDRFTNVEVSSGRIENLANGSMVVAYTLPGVIKSLEAEEGFFSEDLDVPENFVISADVENFELTTAMTAVVNAGSLTDINSDVDMSKVDEMIDTLSDASAQLEDGSKQLSEGLTTLKEKLGTFKDGMDSLNTGVKDYTDGALKVADGIDLLNGSIPDLSSGVTSLADGMGKVKDNSKALVDGSAQVTAGVTEVQKGVQTLEEELTNKINAVAALSKNSEDLGDAFLALYAVMQVTPENYETGVKQLAQGKASQTVADTVNEAVDAQVASAKEAWGKLAPVLGPVLTGDLTDLANVQAQLVTMAKNNMLPEGLTVESIMTAYTVANMSEEQVNALKAQKTAEALEANAATIEEKVTEGVNALLPAKDVYAAYCAAIQANSIAPTDARGFVGGFATGVTVTAAGVNEGASALLEGLDKLYGGSKQVSDGMAAIYEQGIVPVYDGITLLNSKVPTLSEGVTALHKGSKELVGNNDKLVDGAKQLKEGTAQIVDGVDQLQDGSVKLYDGMVQFNKDGISRIVNAYTGDIKPLSNKLQAMIDASNDYQSFTGLKEDVNGSVKFVYKLQSISAE